MERTRATVSRRRNRAPRSRIGIIGGAIAIAAIVASAANPATQAVAEIKPVPVASGYDYSPGEPAIWGSIAGTVGAYYDKACSGGFAIAGDSGFFLTTAATCGWMIASDRSIRGDSGYYADVFATRATDPTVLLRMRSGNDAHQILVDPTTGVSPGDGRVQGWTPTSSQSVGMLVGKMGIDTGWTEGKILGIAPGRFGEYLICTDAPAGPGDVGGPVWRWDASGLRALGTIAGITEAGGACYRPIQETLYAYGAYLPSFGASQGRPSWGTFAPGMVDYTAPVNVTYTGRIIDKGDEWRLP
ncbi:MULTISPECIES: hypothetical protein [unclassified Microbacterium]|uniref:hypothetical protein n=1 Tax=unclassified Microbacterium TaxID=2609290 RepID=UPI0034372E7B